MNEQSETERSSTSGHWFGLDRLRLSDDEQAIDVTIGSESHWDRSHLRRLRQSGDLPGMVPIIDADFSADGKPFAVTPAIEAPDLGSLIDSADLEWVNGACITEAAARAAYEAHLRGLFHGALSPEDVYVIDDDVAIGGIGLGLGGTPPEDRQVWVAPEVRDGAEPTERSDVYSLGKILESSLGESLDTVPRSIRRLIMWSSSDTPEARPPSAMEFASILAEGLEEDRQTYGPAFIPTAAASELASQASSAVSNHTPSEVAQNTASGLGLGAATVGAGAAAAGAAALLGNDDDTTDGDATGGDDAEAGFSVSEPAGDEVDPGVTLDDAEDTVVEESDTDSAEVDADDDADDTSSIETVAAETGDHDLADADSDTERDYAAPVAAQTVDLDETYVPRQRRNRAGLVIGAILGIGLAVIAWGLFSSGDDEDVAAGDGAPSTEVADSTDSSVTDSSVTDSSVASDTDTSAAPATTEAPATSAPAATEAPATPTTATPTTAPATTEAPTTEAPTTEAPAAPTTEAPAAVEQADPGEMASQAEGPIAASAAGVQVLHGVPGTEMDVYVDGEAIATGFAAGSIAGPITLEAGDYDVELFAATDLAPANASDRSDDALVSQVVAVGDSPASVVAYLDPSGDLAVSPFLEKLSSVDPGQGRVMVRHLLATGEATAEVNGSPIGNIASGEEAVAEVEAGPVVVEILDGDANVIASASVAVDDGELVSLSAIGSPQDDTAEIVIQRYTGLASAPVAVPTGDSGLLNLGDDETGLRITYGLMVVLVLAGGIVAFRRQRSLS